MNPIFLDTSPLIYYLDGFEPYATKVEQFLLAALDERVHLYTSIITDMEYFVHPYRDNNYSKIITYKSFIQNIRVLKINIGEDVADKAAQIRAKYKTIRTADAIQLASAIMYNCNGFLTNDKQLKQVSEIQVLLVDEL